MRQKDQRSIVARAVTVRFNLYLYLDWVEEKLNNIRSAGSKRPNITATAMVAASLLFVEGPEFYERFFGDDISEIIDEANEELLEEIKKCCSSPEMNEPVEKLYEELEKDSRITSIGVSRGPDGPVIAEVPRSEFARFAGRFKAPHMEDSTTEVMSVILSKPHLINEPRRWTFIRNDGKTITAVMRDEAFLKALDKKEVRETLSTGIRMEIELETKLVLINDEWVVRRRKPRSVTRVLFPVYS